MKNQCFAYVRVSTVKQGEGVSLEAQREAIERYAQQHQLIVSRWFEEKETAAKQGRPIFTEMVKLLKEGAASGVIMHKIDRSARNLRDWATVGDLQDAGVSVHFAAESVDFASRGGRLTADIQAVIAADYIRNLKDEIRKGQHGRLKQGLYPFTAPFGYLDAGKGLPKTIDPVRGPLVRQMFELYSTGEFSFLSLEREMYRRGLRSVGGKKVYLSKIETIFANPFYAGLIRLESYPETFQGQHEALVSMELFNRVQEVKKQRSRKKKTKHTHLYRGVFACRECSNAMIGERQRGHVYYRCHTASCPTNSIRETHIDWQVLKALSQFRLKEAHLALLEKRLSESARRQPKVGKALDLEYSQIEAQIERLTDGYLTGTIDEKTFASRKVSLEFRQAELSERANIHQTKQEKNTSTRKFLEHVQSLARTYFFANHSEKRQLLDLCFSNKSIFAKNVEIAPQEWLWVMSKHPAILVGAPHDGESRSLQDLKFPGNRPSRDTETISSSSLDCAPNDGESRSRQLFDVFEEADVLDPTHCPEVERFNAICSQVRDRFDDGKLPEIPTDAAYRDIV